MRLLKTLLKLGLMLTLTSCVRNISVGVPCEALQVIYYEDVKPESAEVELLLNNEVISEVCKK